jgi:Bacterial protein of unknown function (DUF916)
MRRTCLPDRAEHVRFMLVRSVSSGRFSARIACFLMALLAVLFATATVSAAAPSASSSPSSSGVPPRDLPGANRKEATFGIGAANTKKVDGRPYLRFLTSPKAVVTDHVAIQNIDVKPVTLSVYAVDAVNSANGSIAYLARADKSTGAGAWLHVQLPGGKSTITLRPRSTVVVPVRLAVPANATPGDHAAGIMVSLTSKVQGKSSNVNLEQRVALRSFVRVSGPLRPQLTVQSFTATYHGSKLSPSEKGTATLTYRVANTGNVELGASQSVAIKGMFGSTGSAPKMDPIPLLLPGGATNVSMSVPDVMAEFKMKATVTLFPLILSGDADPPAAKVTATSSFSAVPWAWIVILILIALVVVAIWQLRRRARRTPPAGRGGGHRGPKKPKDGPRDSGPTDPAKSPEVVGS